MRYLDQNWTPYDFQTLSLFLLMFGINSDLPLSFNFNKVTCLYELVAMVVIVSHTNDVT